MRPAAVAFTLLVAGAGSASAQRVAYEGSAGLSTGNYIFTTRTTTWSLTNGLAFTAGAVTFRVALPVWMQNSTVVSGTGMGGVPSGGSSSDSVGMHRGGSGGMSGAGGPVAVARGSFTSYRVAVGDPVVGVTAALRSGDGVRLAAGAVAKAPVADTASFGTGQWDFGATGSLSVPAGSTARVSLDLAWWHLGDLPGLDFQDPVSATLSVMHASFTGHGMSAWIRAGSSPLSGYDPPVMVGIDLLRLSPAGGVGVELSAGLTETVPDIAVSAFWRRHL